MISTPVRAQPEFVSEFIVGKYLLVGEANSDSTYTGRIEIYIESDELKIKRIVNNQEVLDQANLIQILMQTMLPYSHFIYSKQYHL